MQMQKPQKWSWQMPNREKIFILPPLELESMEMRTGNSYMAGKLKRVSNQLHFTHSLAENNDDEEDWDTHILLSFHHGCYI